LYYAFDLSMCSTEQNMTEAEQQQIATDSVKAIGFTIVCVLIISSILATIMFTLVRNQEESRAEEILDNVRLVFRDAEITLDYLNTLPHQTCSEENLNEMRKTLFRSRFVKEIGFYENNKLKCSTYLGVLDVPFESVEPNFYTATGDEFWIDTPLKLFDKQATGTIAKRGLYNAVLDMDGVIGYSFTKDWQLFYNGEEQYHIAGNRTLISKEAEGVDVSANNSFFSLEFVKCDDRYSNTCLKVNSDRARLLDLHMGKLILLICVMVMTAALTHMLTFNYLRKRRSIDARILHGLENNKFYCLYQPFVDLKTGKVIGCEVLSRFEDEYGPIYPDEFIPQIKAQGKTWEFTLDMIKTAMNELNGNDDIPEGFKVSFNLFPFDFTREESLDLDFVQNMNEKEFKLVLEITEDEQIATQSAIRHIKTLKRKGFMFAIDDFGVGYSNLSQLKSLNCDFLKIDRSFVMEMEDNSIRSSLIPHIVSIAEGLEVGLIAEGVENLDQSNQLQGMTIGFGQGWLYGKPQTVESLAESVLSAAESQQ